MSGRICIIMLFCIVPPAFAQVHGIRTVVVKKTVKNASPNWNVYAKPEMEQIIGVVSPGDSVTVYAWKPWTYKIESKSGAGYISWRALLVTPALLKMARELEIKSDSLLQAAAKADSLKKYSGQRYWQSVLDPNAFYDSGKTIRDASIPSDQSAFLRLYASDTDIEVGECTVVTFSFYVSDLNKVPMQFYNLSDQLDKLINSSLIRPDTWGAHANIASVQGRAVNINGTEFDEYRLYSAAYCPVYAKPIDFNQTSLMLLKVDRKTKSETPLLFTAKPLKINVRAANNESATKADFFKLTGRFQLTDSIQVFSPGSPILYSLTLKGKGYTFPLQPPDLVGKDFTAEIISVEDTDTILNDTYYSSKTFTWKLYLKGGEHSLWSKPVFSYYDPESKSVKALSPQRQISVPAGQNSYLTIPPKTVPEYFILIDASHSMMIEDYTPNRLGVVNEGIYDFLTKRSVCDVGLIAFSGRASRIDVADKDNCYSSTQIQKIGFTGQDRGTAMGDAVWLTLHSNKSNSPVKKIVMISDGENTAGYTNFFQAIELAKKYKVIVHSIGIGKSGEVPFGRSPAGQPLLIRSNFTGNMLKQIAAQTGGKYLHAQSAAEITAFLTEILAK